MNTDERRSRGQNLSALICVYLRLAGFLLWPALYLVTVWPAESQPEAASPTFDVASVKAHQPSNPLGTMMQELPGKIQYRRIPLLAVIRRAYGVESRQIMGPAWLSTERYDIEAKMPPETPDDRFRLMLQNLLAERFHLRVHHGKKELLAYGLVLAKEGLKMHPSESGRLGYAPSRDASGRHLRGRITFPILADNLSGMVGRPVSDQTGVDGLYNIDLNFVDDASTGRPGDYPDIFTALQEQLGLKLQSKKAWFDTIIVDEAEKIPTEN